MRANPLCGTSAGQADVPHNGSKQLAGIIAGPNDDLYVMVNRATYAVVSLFGFGFGFGFGVYDVNAIESNSRPVDFMIVGH